MSSQNTQLHPGICVRPILSLEDVEQIVKRYYGLRVVKISELNGYDDKNYHIHVEKTNRKCTMEEYIFKVVNIMDSEKEALFEAQSALLIHLGK